MWRTRMQKNCNWKKMDLIVRGYFCKKVTSGCHLGNELQQQMTNTSSEG